MKKLATFVLAVGFLVSSFTGAYAGEFKPNAQFINQFEGGSAGNMFASPNAPGLGTEENFKASLRLRLGFDYIASEDLSGTFLMQIGDSDYGMGNTATAGGQGTTEFDGFITNFKVRLAYIDWVIPRSAVEVRMGFQPVALPAFAFGSAVLDTRGSGVTLAAPINDNVALNFMWARAKSDDHVGTSDDADILAIYGDFTFDGFRIAPWAMYAMSGVNAGQIGNVALPSLIEPLSSDIMYLGASFEFSMLEPLRFALDAYYSSASFDNAAENYDGDDIDGFYVGASVDYKTSKGTLALKGWYATGDDETATPHERGHPSAIIGGFDATTIMFGDQVMDNGMSNYCTDPNGTAGVLLEWRTSAFIEKLDQTTRIAYIVGTNDMGDAKGASVGRLQYLNTEESVIEFNSNCTYEIYKNLSATLEFGYLTADFNQENIKDGEDDAIVRTALSFTYTF